MSLRSLSTLRCLSLLALSSVVACGGGDDAATGGGPPTPAGGKSGASGTAAGASGANAGNAGAPAGQGGSAGSAGAGGGNAGTGAAGSGGNAGTSAAGSGGSAGTSAAGSGGNAGTSAAGSGGSAGTSVAGSGGSAGTSAAGSGGNAGGGTGGAGGAPLTCVDTCKAGTCVGETCCAVDSVCGSKCCAQGDVCSFDTCITPGKVCTESADCDAADFCDFSLATTPTGGPGGNGGAAGQSGGVCAGGIDLPNGKCLPRPPACAPGQGGGPGPITCVQACQFKPPTIPFEPAEVYSWGGDTSVAGTPTSIMMAPIVMQLDDDDCDGKVTERDIPDIVFATFSASAYTAPGPLHVVSVKNGKLEEKWVVPNGAIAGRSIAAGNFDGKPGNEIVACTATGIAAYEGATGKLLWVGDTPAACSMPAIADLDQDGKPEIIVEGGIFRGADGTRKAAFAPAFEGKAAITDLDGDGFLDIVGGRRAYHGDGVMFASLPASDVPNDSYLGPAIADLDGDGVPEVLNASFNNHSLAVWHIDPTSKAAKLVRPPVDINLSLDTSRCGGNPRGGGPVTAGDFNNDGHPDVALAGGIGYVVLDGTKLMDVAVAPKDTILWSKTTQDCSSAQTGSSLFDFDGDGKAEVVYADELLLHVYDGQTGTDLFNTCSTNGTLFEYPLVADIDNDGHADLLLVSNAYSGFKCTDGTKRAGLRVFSDPRWVRTRRVWNQHAYSVTNINEDGSVPEKEANNWSTPGLNNFRQNKQPGQEFSAPDLVVSLSYPKCSGGYGLIARVTNVGEASVPAGVTVGFYLGAPGAGSFLGKAVTTAALYPAQSENVTLAIDMPSPALTSGTTPFYAIVDDVSVSAPHPAWTECRTDNNTGKAGLGSCGKD